MSNRYYELFQQKCTEIDDKMKKFDAKIESAKKLRGAIGVEVLKQIVEEYLKINNEPYKVSLANSYILGSHYEYDLIIIKQEAKELLNLLYDPSDVVAIIECKVGGLYNVEKNTDSIASAVNAAYMLNNDINFGYITMSENVPKNEVYNGKPTVKHWERTKEYLNEKIRAKKAIYAVTLHTGKKLIEVGSDDELYDFIKFLINQQ